MSADDLWMLMGVLAMVVVGVATWRFAVARRRSGEVVMTLYDRADAMGEGMEGLGRILRDNQRASHVMLHRQQDPAVERWRLVIWAGVALTLVDIVFGHDLAARLILALG